MPDRKDQFDVTKPWRHSSYWTHAEWQEWNDNAEWHDRWEVYVEAVREFRRQVGVQTDIAWNSLWDTCASCSDATCNKPMHCQRCWYRYLCLPPKEQLLHMDELLEPNAEFTKQCTKLTLQCDYCQGPIKYPSNRLVVYYPAGSTPNDVDAGKAQRYSQCHFCYTMECAMDG